MTEPSDVSELRSFLVVVNFNGKFLDNILKLTGPLDDLLKNNVQLWARSQIKDYIIEKYTTFVLDEV